MSEDIHIRHADVLRRVRELEAEVAHFQAEYQDAVGRTELIANVETLKAEVATLKRKLDDASQLIKMRTADCATLKADNANHLKLNATLLYERDMARSDNADLRAEAKTARELMYAVTEERDELRKQKAGLEAERDKAERKAFAAGALNHGLASRIESVAAERDRLKTARQDALVELGFAREAAGIVGEYDNTVAAIDRARSALASNPSTEEGG